MRIYWPCKMELPHSSYEGLTALHGDRVRVNWARCVDWKDIDGLADYLVRNAGREGWIYTVHHMAQVERAARTRLPFRVLDFFNPAPGSPPEVSSVVQVHGHERDILWLNPIFQLTKNAPVAIQSARVH